MVQDIEITDFDYPLPDERIARHPLAERDACRLIVSAPDGALTHTRFNALPSLLPAGSLMVCNETRVINARMEFHRATGARIEVFLLSPSEPEDYVLTFQTRGRCVWHCMIGNLKKWKPGETLEREILIPADAGQGGEDGTHPGAHRGASRRLTVRARRLGGEGGTQEVEFTWDDPEVTFASVVEAAGHIPIPPYLQRESEESDSKDYQTVYSRVSGSVAAPTAGLHFTPALFEALRRRDVEVRKVTLHVGAGTFQPVKSDTIGAHPMHTETFSVERGTVEAVRDAVASGRAVTAVGTTTVRTLESLPVLGAMIAAGDESMHVGQWTAYEENVREVDTLGALDTLLAWIDDHDGAPLTASTAIMIAPGFSWRIVSTMVTNFHQPQSTLLLLVSSFLDGDADPKSDTLQWKRIYREALAGDYRFLSYGDACLLSRRTRPLPEPATEDEATEDGTAAIHLPGSKSISARALVCDFLGGGTCVLHNLSTCDDTRAMERVLDGIGASRSEEEAVRLDVGEGGTTLRFALAVAASLPGTNVILSGTARLMERPLLPLVEALRDAGAEIMETETARGIPGWHVRGTTLRGVTHSGVTVESSQFASALLLSAPVRDGDTTLRIGAEAPSQPYIEMTAHVMGAMGADVSGSVEKGAMEVGGTGYRLPASFAVEPDWSAASYFYEADRVLRSQGHGVPRWAFVPPLAEESWQGDARVRKMTEDFDALSERLERKVLKWIVGGTWHEDFSDAPDLVPAMACMACGCGVKFEFKGVGILRLKESDRLAALADNLGRLGFQIKVEEDSMSWSGHRERIEPAHSAERECVEIDPHGDHRMAMALAPLAACGDPLSILDAGCVAKSFPGYWEELAKMGYAVEKGEEGTVTVSVKEVEEEQG